MPIGDGTGPEGKGPGTGRGLGKCGNNLRPGVHSSSEKWVAIVGFIISLMPAVVRLIRKGKNKS
ncbi:MAG TPA: DUF5320 domain-containing protein [Elusimicrobiales bacterium]|nr:DUF5320 domain-containing protein [Elusimicrobiales bacterium]